MSMEHPFDVEKQSRDAHSERCDFLKGYDSKRISLEDIKVDNASSTSFVQRLRPCCGSLVVRRSAHAGTAHPWCSLIQS